MKIPTLIGIALIIALIGSLGLWFLNRQKISSEVSFNIADLEVVNITNTTATVIWQTSVNTQGEVVFGESENLNNNASDVRDLEKAQERIVHFVNLKDLKPDTKYFFKVQNNSALYPEKPQEFKTASVKAIGELDFSFLKPIKGTILNTDLNPVDESLIFVEIPNAQKLATFSSTSGNFILPLKQVLNENLAQVASIAQDTPAILIVKKSSLESKVKLLISDETVNLPPITLGTNLDLTNYSQSPISTISIGQHQKVNLDFNNDGKINSLDLAILRGKADSKRVLSLEEQSQFDITSDGVINQEDIDEFSKALTN